MMTYPKSQQKWDKENTLIFSVKFFRRTEQDMIDYMDGMVDKESGIGRGTVLKLALREYMQNHPKETKEAPNKPFWEELEEEEN